MDPLGGTAYQLMGTSQFLSVPYAMYAGDDGDWIADGDRLISNVTGNVGIGTVSPVSKLTVREEYTTTNTIEDILALYRGTSGTAVNGIGAGIVFRNQVSDGTFPAAGRITSKILNASSSNTTSGMLFETHASSGNMTEAMFIDPNGKIGLGNTNPLYGIDLLGNCRITTGNNTYALLAYGSYAGQPIAYFANNSSSSGYGLSAGMSNSSASISSSGLYGFNSGSGVGVYGKGTGIYGYGVKGDNVTSNTYGQLGGYGYAVYGQNGSGNFGYIGGNSHAMYAFLSSTSAGNYAVYGKGVHASGVSGNSYEEGHTIGGVSGFNSWGNTYTFGVAGYSYIDYDRSGAGFGGKYSGTTWGCMAYQRTGGSEYGGYFTSYTSGSGKDDGPQVNNGIGAYGDLFGADIHGKVYGAFIEGGNYACYENGTVFKNGLDVHLQENGTKENSVLYTNVSTDVTVQTSGYANLNSGKGDIPFGKDFTDVVSSNEPIIVTVTPMGNSNGVFLTSVTKDGFSIEENNEGKSNVMVSYIAIGKRAGYENPELPKEVVAKDYASKLSKGLHNDNDLGTNGKGLYYENGELTVGIHPSTLPEPIRKDIPTEEMEKERKMPEDSFGDPYTIDKKGD
jgi:hypothetical protein